MTRVAFAAALLCAAALTLHAQPPPPPPPRDTPIALTGTGTIRGRVVAADTGDPLRKVRVSLSGPGSVPPVFTGNDGRFVFTNLPPDHYVVSARKAGYVATTFGAQRPDMPPIRIDLEERSIVDAPDLRMAKSGAVSGRIIDEFGDPIESATIQAQRVIRVEGLVRTSTIASTVTDDLGEYRLGALPAGTFVVSATLPRKEGIRVELAANGVPATVITGGLPTRTYYPGVTSLTQAQIIVVRSGEERTSTDFTAAFGHLARVSVSFFDPKGDPAQSTAFLLNESAGGAVGVGLPMIGDKVTTLLEAGDWSLFARGSSGVGTARFSVGSDDIAVTVTVSKGARVTGRVVGDGRPLPRFPGLDIQPFPAGGLASGPGGCGAGARSSADGTFELTDLVGPCELRVRSGAPRGWAVKAILYQGRNILGRRIDFKAGDLLSGVQIVLTDRPSELSGAVVDPEGKRLSDYSVLAIPSDPADFSAARVRWARPNQNGRFAIEGLVAGEYVVVAVDDVDETQWLNADYLGRFRPRATRVTIGDSEKKTVELEVVR
jgi:hypothetical protein